MFTRRGLLQVAAIAFSAKAFPCTGPLFNGAAINPKGISMDLPEQYPAYSSELIRTIVTVAHYDLAKLKELINLHPQLVKSAWDWGFGDWETPLGAACHMGRTDIAEYLLSQGATPSLFSYVLLGNLQLVQEIVEQQPGIQSVAGPHSISLLAHARMGGKRSETVLEYLRKLKDADSVKPVPLNDDARKNICGSYRFGASPTQVVEVSDDMGPYLNNPMYTYAPQLNWTRHGTIARPLFHLGGKVFYPAGAPHIRIQFEGRSDSEVMLVIDAGNTLSASRQTAERS